MPKNHALGRRLLQLGCAAAVGLVLSACSADSGSQGDKKDYAVPSSLCGTPVAAADLAPLLPGGQKIAASRTVLQGYTTCYLSVDGKRVLSALGQRTEAGSTVDDVADSTYGLKTDGDRVETATTVVSDEAAVAQVPCAKPRADGALAFATIRKLDGSAERDALKKAVSAFAESLATSTPLCTENDS